MSKSLKKLIDINRLREFKSKLNAQNVFESWPDGAEAHNAMWGGRDITADFDAGTVSEHIADGTFKDIFPGDYITKSITVPPILTTDSPKTYTVNWVIADCDYWINKGDTAMTAHHVVIVPQVPIFDAQMNSTNTNEGGYASSWMYRATIPRCATGIVSAFGSEHILTFRDSLSWIGGWQSQQCNLLSEAMVYDGPHCASDALDDVMATRQMSAFRLSEKLINYNRQGWWLRNVNSSASFTSVLSDGRAYAPLASYVFGVRPFALLR